MNIGGILLSAIILFIAIYFTVSFAIKPLIDNKIEENDIENDIGLIKLRDMGIVNMNEVEEIIKLYQSRAAKQKEDQQYKKYEKILHELEQMVYFTEEECLDKLGKLKTYYKMK